MTLFLCHYLSVSVCICVSLSVRICACDAGLMKWREDILVLCVASDGTSAQMRVIPFFRTMIWKSYLTQVLISLTFSWYLLLISALSVYRIGLFLSSCSIAAFITFALKCDTHSRIIRPGYTAVLYGRVTRLQYGCNTGDIFHRCCDRVLRPYSPAVQCPCCGRNCWMNQKWRCHIVEDNYCYWSHCFF